MQPFEKSANSWIWRPWRPGSNPVILYDMVVGDPGAGCSKLIILDTAGDDSASPSHGLHLDPPSVIKGLEESLFINYLIGKRIAAKVFPDFRILIIQNQNEQRCV